MIEEMDLDRHVLRAARSLRHMLRMIAAEPAEARQPQRAIGRLRPFVDSARHELQSMSGSTASAREYLRGQAQLVDGAVAGLCHVARFGADEHPDSIVPPFAAVGVDLRARHRSEPSALELLFVVPENMTARERADRMVAFVLVGLSDLGFSISHASCTPGRAASLAQLLAGKVLTSHGVRFIWGSSSLYDDLVRSLPAPESQSELLAP